MCRAGIGLGNIEGQNDQLLKLHHVLTADGEPRHITSLFPFYASNLTPGSMDIQQYASHRSDPLWEEPTWRKEHTTIVNFHGANHGVSVEKDEPRLQSPRRDALGEAATKLNSLCASDAPLAEIQDFLAKWENPSSMGRVQPNALAWFNDTNAVQLACTNGNLDVVRTLLEKGLYPTIRAADFARAKWRETNNKEVFQQVLELLVYYGMEINRPVNDHTPPIMR